MDRRTILALVLSALVLVAYQFYMAKHATEDLAGTADVESGISNVKVPDQGYSEPVAKSEFLEEEIKSTIPLKEVEIETEKYVVTLSNEGGCVKSIVLKEYPHPRTNEIFKLVDIENPREGIFSIDDLGGYNLSRIRYNTNERDKEVVFSAQLGNGLEVTKKYIFHNSLYHIDLELYIRNTSGQVLQTGYSIIAGSNIDIPTRIDRRYTQIVSDISGKPRRDNGGKGEGNFVGGIVNYTGLQNK